MRLTRNICSWRMVCITCPWISALDRQGRCMHVLPGDLLFFWSVVGQHTMLLERCLKARSAWQVLSRSPHIPRIKRTWRMVDCNSLTVLDHGPLLMLGRHPGGWLPAVWGQTSHAENSATWSNAVQELKKTKQRGRFSARSLAETISVELGLGFSDNVLIPPTLNNNHAQVRYYHNDTLLEAKKHFKPLWEFCCGVRYQKSGSTLTLSPRYQKSSP